MRKLFKISALLTSFIVCFSLCGCQANENNKDNNPDNTVSKSDYDKLKQDYDSLMSDYSELQQEFDKIKESSTEAQIEEATTEETAETPTELLTEKSEFEFSIKSTSIVTDYAGKDVLVIEYDFTNNSNKATSFTFACQDTVFQDGVECDSTVIGCDGIDAQDQLNDVQSGNTYTLKIGYHIRDLNKPVNLIITNLFGTQTFLEETIDLNT